MVALPPFDEIVKRGDGEFTVFDNARVNYRNADAGSSQAARRQPQRRQQHIGAQGTNLVGEAHDFGIERDAFDGGISRQILERCGLHFDGDRFDRGMFLDDPTRLALQPARHFVRVSLLRRHDHAHVALVGDDPGDRSVELCAGLLAGGPRGREPHASGQREQYTQTNRPSQAITQGHKSAPD